MYMYVTGRHCTGAVDHCKMKHKMKEGKHVHCNKKQFKACDMIPE
jgi:hypothetical protein